MLVIRDLIERGIVFGFQNERERLLARPRAERGEEHEQQGHHDEDRQASAERRNAALLHELALLDVELLRIVAVFLLELLDVGLDRLHLDRRFPRFDVGEDRQKLDREREEKDRQNDDPSAFRKQTAHLPIDPVHRDEQPFDEEKG